MNAKPGATTTGIPDPDDPSRWLVCPWPVRASFCEVVRHFLRAYVWRLQSDTSTARQLAYFEGYQAALNAAPLHELKHSTSWQWRDDLLGCIAECIATFRAEQAAKDVLASVGR